MIFSYDHKRGSRSVDFGIKGGLGGPSQRRQKRSEIVEAKFFQ